MSAASATIIMHAREYRKCLETGKITNLELWRLMRAPNTARGVTEFVINLLHLNLMIGMVVILSEHQLRVQSLWLRHSQQVQDVVGDLALSVHPEGQAAHLRHAVPVPVLPQVLGDLLQAMKSTTSFLAIFSLPLNTSSSNSAEAIMILS